MTLDDKKTILMFGDALLSSVDVRNYDHSTRTRLDALILSRNSHQNRVKELSRAMKLKRTQLSLFRELLGV